MKELRVLPSQADLLSILAWPLTSSVTWFPHLQGGIIMVLPFQVFVRIVINQRKRNTVPRMSFSQEIIAMLISHWTMHLPAPPNFTVGSMKANIAICMCLLKFLGVDQVFNILYIWMCWNSLRLWKLQVALRSFSSFPSLYSWGNWACERSKMNHLRFLSVLGSELN